MNYYYYPQVLNAPGLHGEDTHLDTQDIDNFSLRKRVLDELRFLGTKETPNALYGQPLDPWLSWRKETLVFLDPSVMSWVCEIAKL